MILRGSSLYLPHLPILVLRPVVLWALLHFSRSLSPCSSFCLRPPRLMENLPSSIQHPVDKSLEPNGRQDEACQAMSLPWQVVSSSSEELQAPNTSGLASFAEPNPDVPWNEDDFEGWIDNTIIDCDSIFQGEGCSTVPNPFAPSSNAAAASPSRISHLAGQQLNGQAFNDVTFSTESIPIVDQDLSQVSPESLTTPGSHNIGQHIYPRQHNQQYAPRLGQNRQILDQNQVDRSWTSAFPPGQAFNNETLSAGSARSVGQSIAQGCPRLGYTVEPQDVGEQSRSKQHKQPRASFPGPILDQMEINYSRPPAPLNDQAFNDISLSRGPTGNLGWGLAQGISESASPSRSPDRQQPRQRRRGRSRSSTPASRVYKRRRLDSPFSHSVQFKPSTLVSDTAIDLNPFEVFKSDPFDWSVERVLFVLTSPRSIDLNDYPIKLPSSEACLPRADLLVKFIWRGRIDGYNLLLCTDRNAMRNSGITEPAHHRALGEYIVKFRTRSPGYRGYCWKNNHPRNFSATRLIDAAQVKDVVEREWEIYMEKAKEALSRVRVRDETVCCLHYPIGCIEARKREYGQLEYTLQSN